MKRKLRPAADQAPLHPFEALLNLLENEPDEDPATEHHLTSTAFAMREQLTSELAALRRQHTPQQRVSYRLATVSKELHSMGREALLSLLDYLRKQPGVQFAHLELRALSTDELRRAIAEMVSDERTQTGE